MLDIAEKANEKGYISYVAYANSRSNKVKLVENSILIGSVLERNIHNKLAYFTGLNGCFSKYGTKKFLDEIDKLNPDIIHLHNLHNCFINLEMLFEYIKYNNIPVVWTLHDCWAFTGKCPHFTMIGCSKWETGCYNCPQIKDYPLSRVDKTKEMYELKKKWFTNVESLTIVTPSNWLASTVKKSFLKDYPVKVINNGIDLNIFKPTPSNFRNRFNLIDKKILLGVANPWSKRKGLDIFVELSKRLDENHQVVLIGLTSKQMNEVPPNILGLPRTNNVKDLVEVYTAADYFINPSIEETMGLVTVEAIACGTPVIVSNYTAVPEMINKDTGFVVKEYNVDEFYNAINLNLTFKTENLLEWAQNYEINQQYDKYIKLYETIAT